MAFQSLFNLSNETLRERMAKLDQIYEETVEFESKIGVIIPSIFAMVILIGLIGNSSVVLIVAFNRQMRNSTNTLIIGLAISDLLFLTLCIPFTAADYSLPIWVFPKWWCGMMSYLQFVSAYASVWTLSLMSFDRFLAVVFPIQSMGLRTMRNTSIALAILWVIILTGCAPIGFAHDVFNYNFIKETRSTCVFISVTKGHNTTVEVRLFYLSYNCFGFILPLGITTVLYYFMLRRLWGTRPGHNISTTPSVVSSTKSNTKSKARLERTRAKRKVTRMVLGVIVTFAFCWLPLNVCFFVIGITHPENMVAKLGKPMILFQIFSQVLAYANSCLNPILYAFLSENFRKGFRRLFGFVCLCGQTPQRGLRNTPMEQTRMLGTSASTSNSIRIRKMPEGLKVPKQKFSPSLPTLNRSTMPTMLSTSNNNMFELSDIERTTTGSMTATASFISQQDGSISVKFEENNKII